MSSYHINDLDNYPRTYSFLPNNDKDENGENLMTQSLVVQAPYRRIRHPELVPVIINRDERTNYDIMSQSLIVPPYRRVRHNELTPVLSKEPYKAHSDIKNRQQQNLFVKAPKRAFSMTRLDQLAKPRQRYLEEALKLRASVTKENLCSSAVRPTSSMSLASKQQTTSTNSKPANNSLSNNGTIHLRQRTSSRKQRPISYAGYSLNNNSNNSNNKELNNLDSSTTTFSRSSIKAKLPFFGSIINSKNLNNSSFNQNRNLMISSIDESMMVSNLNNFNNSHSNKPIPPKKPAHIKEHIKAASAARKLAKKQDEMETDRIKKSESTSRISNKLDDNNLKDKMKKSLTNPEKIGELIDEALNGNDEQQNKIVIKKSINSKLKSGENEIEDRSCENLKSEILETISNNTFTLENELARDQINSNQSMDLDDEVNSNKLKEENEINRRKQEEELQKQKQLEIEEMERKAQEEEKKRLAKEEKERELERKAKEKIEKARLEMEERLRKDEQERIERKKRLEAIMSRTRKNPSNNSTNNKVTSPNIENVQTSAQQTSDIDNKFEEQQIEFKEPSPKQNTVEDAINLIKLTNKNENNLNSTFNNGKAGELHQHNFIENETALITENKNINLINGFKEMKMSTNSTFVFSQTSTNETFAPGAN